MKLIFTFHFPDIHFQKAKPMCSNNPYCRYSAEDWQRWTVTRCAASKALSCATMRAPLPFLISARVGLAQRIAREGFGLVDRAAGVPDRAVHELVAVASRLPVTATMLPWVLSLNTTRMAFSQ